MIRMPKRLVIAVVLIAVWLIPLVGGSSPSSSLDGTQWKLIGWALSSLKPADFTITAKFADGHISGHSAVNTYSGPCKLDLKGSFSAGALVGTQMAGPEPAMRAETAYLTLLGQAKSYKVVDGKLKLYDKGGNESLIFEAARK